MARLHAILLLAISFGAFQSVCATSTDRSIGSFESPPVDCRPKFRYWLPDASVDPVAVAADMKSIGFIGGGGVEFLPFYNYGGLNGIAVTDWAEYGYGSPAYNTILKSALQASKESGLVMDLCMGPQSGQGVPASADNPGLAYDMVYNYTFLSPGESFIGKIPGYGRGALISVTTAIVLDESIIQIPLPSSDLFPPKITYYNRTMFTVSDKSIREVTSQVKRDGSLSVKFPSGASASKNVVFAAYYKLSLERAVIAGSKMPQNILQNGSFGNFSPEGAKVTTDFLEKYVLVNGVRDLFKQIVWEDSFEIKTYVFWTPKLQATSRKLNGYDIGKYAMLLVANNGLSFGVRYLEGFSTDGSDKGQGYVEDYRSALTISMQSYYKALVDWSRKYVGAEFSGQVGYNLPVDMAQIIPEVAAPEDESYGMDPTSSGLQALEIYRQIVGPSNLAGKRVISNEMGGIMGGVYKQTLPELLNIVKRAWAVGNNQMVYHGATYSGQYPNTTWPGVTSFIYLVGEAWSKHQPVWENGFEEVNTYIARMQWVLQSGRPWRDVALWNKATRSFVLDNAISNNYTDLVSAGYGYEYVSPANFELPLAKVKNQLLAPDGPAYKVLVLRSTDMLTLAGTIKLVQYANEGLPIVIQGGIPIKIASSNGLKKAQENIKSILSLKNVRQVGRGPLAPTLASMGVLPRTQVSRPEWLTYWRHNEASKTDYVLIFSDASATNETSSGTVTFETNKTPFLLNAWTGTEEPIIEYLVSSKKTTISFVLAPGESALIAFRDNKSNQTPKKHVSSAPKNLGYVYNKREGIKIKISASSTSGQVTLSNNKKTTIPAQRIRSPIMLGDWRLIAEKWTPGADFYDSATLGTKTNKTFTLPALKSWPDISGLQNSSGVGYYSTSFTWRKSDAQGAIIDFGPVQNTLRVSINGKKLPPLDYSAAKGDISAYLKEGNNIVEATVATTLYNGLVPYYPDLRSSASSPLFGPGKPRSPPSFSATSVPAGLLGSVVVTPFNLVKVF